MRRAARSCKPVRVENAQTCIVEFDLGERTEQLAEVEKCCVALFERWCEHRRVVPLAHLMHVWPIPKPSVRLARRLASTLRDLLSAHSESLESVDHQLIREAIDAINTCLRH